jgi:branched-chain amino acid transport system ATP-binding protein
MPSPLPSWPSLLVATGISKQFGGIQALSELSFEVGRGEAVGIVGPNGAGKTTLFNCLLGLETPDTGSVVFDGVRIDRLPVWKRSRLGIGRTYQRMELFRGMTVADHLLVSEQASSGTFRFWRDFLNRGGPTPGELHHVQEVLDLLGLEAMADRPVDGLDLGHARLVELGRAMMGAPKLLMLDEPSSGLDTEETARLSTVLASIRSARTTAVVLVEHDLQLVESAVDRLCVLNFGRMLASGRVDEVLADTEVRRAYLGASG